MSQNPVSFEPPLEGLLGGLSKPAVAVSILCGLLAYIYLDELLRPFFGFPNQLENLFGDKTYLSFYTLGILISMSLGFIAIRLVQAFWVTVFGVDMFAPVKQATRRPKEKTLKHYRLPKLPSKKPSRIVLGEEHGEDGSMVYNPTWCQLPLEACYGNLIGFGAIGTGKTQCLSLRILSEIIEFKERLSGLVLDVKGNFIVAAEEHVPNSRGRLHKLQLITSRMNPIHAPDLSAEQLADNLMAVFENLRGKGGSRDSSWIVDGVRRFLAQAIGLHREAYGYVTLHDVNQILTGPLRRISSDDEDFQEQVDEFLESYDLAQRAEGQGDAERYLYYRAYFEKEFPAMNPRNKATLVDASQDFIGQFSNPDFKRSFCPNEEDITFPGIKTLLEDDKIIALDTIGLNSKMVQTIGILLKLEYQRVVLARLHDTEKPPFTFFLCDEYHYFASTAESANQGDDAFVSLSREANCMNIVLTQSPVSLVSKLGEHKTRVLMSNFRTKVFLALTDSQDAKLASDICGEQWEDTTSQTFSERAKATRWNPIADKVDGKNATIEENVTFSKSKRALFDPIDFQQLRKFEALATVYDGQGQRTTKLYLKPVFQPITVTYSELYQEHR